MNIKKMGMLVVLVIVNIPGVYAADVIPAQANALERAAQKLLDESDLLVLTCAERDALLEVVEKGVDNGPEKQELMEAIQRATETDTAPAKRSVCCDATQAECDEQEHDQNAEWSIVPADQYREYLNNHDLYASIGQVKERLGIDEMHDKTIFQLLCVIKGALLDLTARIGRPDAQIDLALLAQKLDVNETTAFTVFDWLKAIYNKVS